MSRRVASRAVDFTFFRASYEQRTPVGFPRATADYGTKVSRGGAKLVDKRMPPCGWEEHIVAGGGFSCLHNQCVPNNDDEKHCGMYAPSAKATSRVHYYFTFR